MYQSLEAKFEGTAQQATMAEATASLASQQAEVVKLHNTRLQNELAVANQTVADLSLRLLAQEITSFNGILVWKIADFNRSYEEARSGRKTSLYSPPFFTSRHGYKVCARVYPNGDGVGKNSHLSIFFVVMRGEFDSLLLWPFHYKASA